jgi:hypothetical protein
MNGLDLPRNLNDEDQWKARRTAVSVITACMLAGFGNGEVACADL